MLSKSTIAGLALLALFTWFTWPKNEQRQSNNQGAIQGSSLPKNQPRLIQEEPFIAKRVIAQENESVKKEAFKVTNPQAIAFNENQKLAFENKTGTTPAITEEEIATSPQLRAAIEATQNPEKLGNRLTPLLAPTLFDREKFITDASYRQEYLNTAEPARAFKSDPDSETKIERISPYYREVEQGGEVVITVKAIASMPVSIMSADLGQFKESGLTYATVLADSGGLATFTFKGVEGTFSDSNIVVSSPVTRGKLKFLVHTKIKNIKDN